MAEKKPPNGAATQFRSGDEAAENGRRGGQASGRRRREKKTIRKILSDYLEADAHSSPAFASLAESLGIEENASVKDLFVMSCLVRSLEDGDMSALEKLTKLLGEEQDANPSEEKLDGLLKEFKDAVKSEAT